MAGATNKPDLFPGEGAPAGVAIVNERCVLRTQHAHRVVLVAGIILAQYSVGDAMVTLYWGARRPKDLYLNELPVKWAAEHAGFKYVPVVSEALPEDRWTGRTGFVHRAVMEDLPDLSGCQIYACGVPIMVDSARRDFFAQCKLPEDEFFADSFTTQADIPQAPK